MTYSETAMEQPIMTTIRTTCATCGVVELTPADVVLELAAGAGEGRYRFDCTMCGSTQRHPVGRRAVSVLLATGVGYDVVPTAGPITDEEIEAFSRSLDGSGWFREIAASDS